MDFSGICLLTQDVRRSADFYQAVLQTRSDCDDEIHQEILTRGAALAILKCDEIEAASRKNFSMAFTVDDVDDEYAWIRAMGIEVVGQPTVRPWGAKNMRFLDPDGNAVVFRSFSKSFSA